MSSIYGMIYLDGRPVADPDIQPMKIAMDHWQPDGSGLWKDGSVAMGHLLLYNTPESLHEKLPFRSNQSGLSITADARLYNRKELQAKLGLQSVIEDPLTDSQLILAAYEKYGERCLEHLIGDFAFAIWNERERTLFCGRDHMGIRPFFYYRDAKVFAFASEKKGILALAGIDDRIDKQFFFNQLIWPPNQALDTTCYEKIRRLKPAHSLMINGDGRMTTKQYWTLDTSARLTLSHQNEYYEGLREHFDEAVRCRIRSIYPVGAELSGGLDSSAITIAADNFLKLEGKRIRTFSNSLSPDVTDAFVRSLDEINYMREVIEFNQIPDPTFITKPLCGVLEDADFTIKVNDGLERYNPSWIVPLRHAAMKKGVRTLLSGFMGDQMVTNQAKFFTLDLLEKKKYLQYFKTRPEHNRGLIKLLPFLPPRLRAAPAKLRYAFGRYDSRTRKALRFVKIPVSYINNSNKVLWENSVWQESCLSLRHLQKWLFLNPNIQLRLDCESRVNLYFRIESVFPMADIRLAQFYSSMPNELKYEGEFPRMAYRKAVSDYLPAGVRTRIGKQGSINPYKQTALMELLNETEALLNRLPKNEIIKSDQLLQRIRILKEMNTFTGGIKSSHMNELPFPSLETLRWFELNNQRFFH